MLGLVRAMINTNNCLEKHGTMKITIFYIDRFGRKVSENFVFVVKTSLKIILKV